MTVVETEPMESDVVGKLSPTNAHIDNISLIQLMPWKALSSDIAILQVGQMRMNNVSEILQLACILLVVGHGHLARALFATRQKQSKRKDAVVSQNNKMSSIWYH